MTGVCTVRVEDQPGDDLLITVTASADADSSETGSRTTQHFSTVGDAVAAIEVFLRGFEEPSDASRAPEPEPPPPES